MSSTNTSFAVGLGAMPQRLMGKSAAKFFIPILSLLICAVLFQWLSDSVFLTPRNLSNLSRQVCVNLTLAVGMTMVILTAGIDLSVGSVLALSGMVAAISQVQWGWRDLGALGAFGSAALALSVGSLSGFVSGFAVSRLRITPFIVSLGMMVICRGATLIISKAMAVAPIGDRLGALSAEYVPPLASGIFLGGIAVTVAVWSFWNFRHGKSLSSAIRGTLFGFLGTGVAAIVFCGYRGIPYMVFVAVVCTIIGMVILQFTRFGRFLYAIGGNREAAELSGVPVAKTLWIVYLLMGALAGLAGLMDTTRANGAVPSAGELAELDAIAAVVIGGTSLMGGLGSITGTIFGVLIMGVLNNGMSLIGVSDHYQKVFKGLVIILAVYFDLRSKKK